MRKQREDVVAQKIECDLNIPKVKLAQRKGISEMKVDHTDEKVARETWSRKTKKTGTHFVGRYLKMSSAESSASQAPMIEGKIDQDIYRACEDFLVSIKLDDTEIKNINEETVLQRDCQMWFERRKHRLTSSLFGKICKRRNESSKVLFKSIEYTARLTTPAVLYGIDREATALCEYTKKTSRKVEKVGLFIHPEHNFLGASPDGLVEDGVIEIKCPFTAKDENPNEFTFNFLNVDGELRPNHDYYFQIQGILEITNREWCDLIIYTSKGIRIVNIKRSRSFWSRMLQRLTEFYYFEFIPYHLFPNRPLSAVEKKWTTSKLIRLLENGLVDDVDFYKKLKNGRDYVVTVNTSVTSVKELIFQDFDTLSGKQCLSSFVIDHCLQMLTDTTYQIFSVERASIIMSHSEYTENFLNSTTFEKERLVLPVESGMHFFLFIIDFMKNKIIYLDPLGVEKSKSNFYFSKILNFLANKEISCSDWQIVEPDHVTQKDSFNCGVYVVHFFNKILLNENLNEYIDINLFRRTLKYMLLRKSMSVKLICFYCGSKSKPDDFVCRICQRHSHLRCLSFNVQSDSKNYIPSNSMCDLCRQNLLLQK